ncbi:hypothetical protein I8J29_28535 [Paenibacillus sp. MWE-103]|uniref:Peptidase A4 family protein n=1 Tax=Paenibacillus artemisiicola TaxID=1172618 RepID=A0ABS3WII8_9BACL|nr:G1 family glutamic endopeptidase [Paenibacillus artemisiicola]MBO7748146.1 hypothetical protein [Paenibacillus artemisiicola]
MNNIRRGSAPRKRSTFLQPRPVKIPPGWRAENWSGYAISGNRGAYRRVSGYWAVPRVKSAKGNRYSSAWIGIDGFDNPFLIQTGTAHGIENGKASYYPWWEILPAYETRIPRPVAPGDAMFAQITKLRGGKWRILLRNRTKGWTFKTVQAYAGPASSAEWILEAPTVGFATAPLANYGRTAFFGSRLNGKRPCFKRRNRGVMAQNGRIVSTPSLPNKARDGFRVAYGPDMPTPPC